MPRKVRTEAQPKLPSGWYGCVCLSAEEKVKNDDDTGESWDLWVIGLRAIKAEDGSPLPEDIHVAVDDVFSFKETSNTKAPPPEITSWRAVEAFGIQLTDGAIVGAASLLGKEVLAKLIPNDSGDGNLRVGWGGFGRKGYKLAPWVTPEPIQPGDVGTGKLPF